MATSFTVILFQRQLFGDKPDALSAIEPNVPFVGLAKDFPFDCPNVDPRETAILMFQSLDVQARTNVFQINGVDVFGGLPISAVGWSDLTGSGVHLASSWNGNILLVEPRHQLKSTGNIMHVESRPGASGRIDAFIIDNVVIMYKTVDRQTPPFGEGGTSPI